MTVREVIERLQKCPQDAEVKTQSGVVIDVCCIFDTKDMWFEDDKSFS
jgi:hypothetical protein